MMARIRRPRTPRTGDPRFAVEVASKKMRWPCFPPNSNSVFVEPKGEVDGEASALSAASDNRKEMMISDNPIRTMVVYQAREENPESNHDKSSLQLKESRNEMAQPNLSESSATSEKVVEEMIPLRKRERARKWGKREVAWSGSRVCAYVNTQNKRCRERTFVDHSVCEYHLGETKIKSLKSIYASCDQPRGP